MTKFRRLKKEAVDGCGWHGHVMGRFETTVPRNKFGRTVGLSKCAKCGMDVQVITRPLPNEIDIGGEAVALDCEVTTFHPAGLVDYHD